MRINKFVLTLIAVGILFLSSNLFSQEKINPDVNPVGRYQVHTQVVGSRVEIYRIDTTNGRIWHFYPGIKDVNGKTDPARWIEVKDD